MVTTITRPSSDFTNRDFDSWVIELRNRAVSAFPGWTDYNTPNFGNILLESFAHTLDQLSYTQDQQHKERFVIWARLRRSMIWLGLNVSFTLPGAVPASVDLEFTFASGDPVIGDVVVPKGTAITNPEGDVIFYTLADAEIIGGLIQLGGVAAENAQEEVEAFVAPGVAGHPVVLGAVPYVDGSAVVEIGVDTYTEVSSFYNSGPTDKHFRVDVDEDDRATIVFGDGVNGVIPVGAGTVTYKVGGGSAGNLDANTLTEFVNTNRFTSSKGEIVTLTVRNPSESAGGVDRMSVEEARVAIPAHMRTTGQRSVTRTDFEDNAMKVRGVARAMILTSDDDGAIPENSGRLYIVPVGGGLPSAALKTEVLAFITTEYPPCLSFTLSVHDPVLKIISVGATVHLNRTITEAQARTAVETALDNLFALESAVGVPNEQVDFGFKIRHDLMPEGSAQGEFPWSDIFNALRDATTPSGQRVFRKIEEDLVAPADDVALLDTEFPVLGSISLINGDTGLAF